MKKTVKSILLIAAALYFMTQLVACAKKSEDNQGAAVDARGRTAGATTPTATNSGFKDGYWTNLTDSQAGKSTIGASNFETIVKDFLNASFDNQGAGSISNTDGVYISGYFELAANGQINLPVSKLKISVLDSYYKEGFTVEEKKATPYYVAINAAASGSWKDNNFTMVFKDEFQEITIEGTIDKSTAVQVVNGVVSFKNLKDFSNQNLKSASPMGYFSIQACAIMNCSK